MGIDIKKFRPWSQLNESEMRPDDEYQSIKVVDNGDAHVTKMALNQIGDMEEPNMFFVTTTNDYTYHSKKSRKPEYYFNDPKAAPIKIEDHIIREIFGPFQSLAQAKVKADTIDLDHELGPRRVVIDDRLSGPVYERVLKAETKIVWQEDEKGSMEE